MNFRSKSWKCVWGWVAVALGVSATAACSAEPGSDDAEAGDNDYAEDDIVSERQLFGADLPAKTFVLTFDDGPGGRTSELGEYLQAKGISATFFMNGRNVPGRQRVLADLVTRGHTLANHTQNHVDMRRLSGATLFAAVDDTDAFLRAAQPSGPWLLRAPYGAWNGRVAGELNQTAMKKYVGSIFWEVGGQLTTSAGADWACWNKGLSVQRCAELYLMEARSKGRGIVLIHDVHNKSVDMTKVMVETLQREGYRFAKLTDVPSVRRAIGTAPAPSGHCQSATLGRAVPPGACVKSARDGRWYLCSAEDWASIAAPTDARCTSLPQP